MKDYRFEYDDHRFITLGMVKDIVVVIAHTETDEEIRVIFMRKATRNEQKKYFESLKD